MFLSRQIEKCYARRISLCYWGVLLNRPLKKRVRRILQYSSNQSEKVNATGERALPGDKKFLRSGYYRKMLSRYILALQYTRDKIVLDSCSGLGWGSYLVAHNARKIVGIDIHLPSLRFAKETWEGENISYIRTNALSSCFPEECFDVILAMESIEHFNKDDGILYIKELSRMLKRGGILIASSYFAHGRDKASEICSMNIYHLDIFTKTEIKHILQNLEK